MDQIWPTMTAVLAANFLTVLFVWGLWRARKIYDDRDADYATLGALIVPLLFAFGGFYLYT